MKICMCVICWCININIIPSFQGKGWNEMTGDMFILMDQIK